MIRLYLNFMLTSIVWWKDITLRRKGKFGRSTHSISRLSVAILINALAYYTVEWIGRVKRFVFITVQALGEGHWQKSFDLTKKHIFYIKTIVCVVETTGQLENNQIIGKPTWNRCYITFCPLNLDLYGRVSYAGRHLKPSPGKSYWREGSLWLTS